MRIPKLIFVLLLTATAFESAEGKELEYFDTKIDYWGEKPSPMKNEKVPSVVEQPKEKFPWKTYLDPKNKEFFKEGDYTPPEPFMEIARDPSDENIKNWFEFMKRKNELAARLEQKMQEYLARNEAPGLAAQIGARVARNDAAPRKQPISVALDPARFRIRMYFDSHCPHCRRMFGVLKRLKDEGFSVEALQVDSGPVSTEEKIVPIGKASLSELKGRGGSAVPFLLIADLKRKALLPGVEGYHDYEEVIALLKEASRG